MTNLTPWESQPTTSTMDLSSLKLNIESQAVSISIFTSSLRRSELSRYSINGSHTTTKCYANFRQNDQSGRFESDVFLRLYHCSISSRCRSSLRCLIWIAMVPQLLPVHLRLLFDILQLRIHRSFLQQFYLHSRIQPYDRLQPPTMDTWIRLLHIAITFPITSIRWFNRRHYRCLRRWIQATVQHNHHPLIHQICTIRTAIQLQLHLHQWTILITLQQ